MSRGFTLIELLVVLVVIAVAIGIVAPAFVPPRASSEPALATLIRRAQDIAASREETVYLGISASGNWRIDPGAARASRPIATGDLQGYTGPRAILVISPLGTCGFDVQSSDAARAIALDPLTCEVVTS